MLLLYFNVHYTCYWMKIKINHKLQRFFFFYCNLEVPFFCTTNFNPHALLWGALLYLSARGKFWLSLSWLCSWPSRSPVRFTQALNKWDAGWEPAGHSMAWLWQQERQQSINLILLLFCCICLFAHPFKNKYARLLHWVQHTVSQMCFQWWHITMKHNFDQWIRKTSSIFN